MVSVVRHASGVEDSFLSWPPKGVEELFSNPILHHVFTPNKERERERNKEEQRARNTIASKFNNGGFCKQRYDPRVCVYIARRQNLPKFLWRRREEKEAKLLSIFLGASLLLHEFCISLSVSLSLCECMFYYEGVCKVPCSYRQPSGRGQLLSRRYCKHSVWYLSCAPRTAKSFNGTLAVPCKYFKQSKWPFLAASSHAYSN